MTLHALTPEPIVPRNPKPRTGVIRTEEAKIAAEIANLPTPAEMQQIAAAVAAKAAKDILLGVLPFKNAGEASKVARDFAHIAKEFSWDDERETIMAAETAEDRKESLAAFKARALEALENGH
jgi:hypothetical protein